ncbi:MAG: FHA domain-containing protein [Marinilabiliaceae bacterium]|nr:FHA domain-containing protein [Marinilabiliaceae bacterium]
MNFTNSFTSGIKSFSGENQNQYYILEHQQSSKYNKEGERQEIIIDKIEIGRAVKCQVRFDESFVTVSRQHAEIVKDNHKWKFLHLSETNPSFINGTEVSNEQFLDDNDEIQLAVAGPKLKFILPENSAVENIEFPKRLNLFWKQVLRPVKIPITMFLLIMALGIIGLSSGLFSKKTHKLIDKCKDDVYFLWTEELFLTDGYDYWEEVEMENGEPYSWSGTGFLMKDGRFVTARHCVQPWRFTTDKSVLKSAAQCDRNENLTLTATIYAENRVGDIFVFDSDDFIFSDVYDVRGCFGRDENGSQICAKSIIHAEDSRANSSDWAYVQTNSCGSLKADFNLSKKLKSGMELYVLGFPADLGLSVMHAGPEPIYHNCSVGLDGLNYTGCFLHTRGADFGNSGGPIFARKRNKLVVVGIVSAKSQSAEYNYGVPIAEIRNY